jgi:hypothetical protein
MSSGLTKGVIMSDEDLVVLAKPRFDSLTSVENEPLKQKNPVSATKSLEMQMSTLSLSSKKAATKKAKKIKRSKKATASPVTTAQQRNGKSSIGLAGVVYPSPAQSPKHADIVQVLHASIT